MSNEVYSVWRNEMVPLYHGALGGSDGVLDSKATLKVPDGLWLVLAKVNLNNQTPGYQTLKVRLQSGDDSDTSVVRIGPDSGADQAAVSLQMLKHFPGDEKKRVNNVSLGVVSHWNSPGEVPKVLVGRIKIVAMRVNHYVVEPYPQ